MDPDFYFAFLRTEPQQNVPTFRQIWYLKYTLKYIFQGLAYKNLHSFARGFV